MPGYDFSKKLVRRCTLKLRYVYQCGLGLRFRVCQYSVWRTEIGQVCASEPSCIIPERPIDLSNVTLLRQRPGRKAVIALAMVFCVGGVAAWVATRTPAYKRPIRVGINHSPPYSFVAKDKSVSGPSKEVITEAARRRGIPLEWVVAPEGPDAALASGKVDLWPLITVLPERKGRIFFTSAWLRARFFLVVLRSAAGQKEREFEGKTIAYRPSGPDLQMVKRYFPRARTVPRTAPHEFQAVCLGEADAAFIEMKSMLVELLDRPAGCEMAQLDLVPVQGANYYLAVGATPKFASVATELRSEMDRMDRDGTLIQTYKKWLFSTTEETQIVSELAGARQRTLFLWWGVGILMLSTAVLTAVVNRVRRAHKIASSAYDFVSAVLDVAGGLVVISDQGGRIVRMNRLCERLTGYALCKIQGKTAWDAFVPARERAQVQSAFIGLAGGSTQTAHEYHWQAFNGEERLISWSNTVLLNSSRQVDYIVSIGTDITDRKAVETQLSYEALHDLLTNLPNRRYFQQAIESAAAEALSVGTVFSLCLCDIDHFKKINDTFGHIAGDEVLSTFSRILRQEMRGRNVAARLGGDEFALILRDVSAAEASRIVERIREQVASCGFRSADDEEFRVTATFGVASMEGSFRTVADLFKQADDALYRAKSLGRNRIVTVGIGARAISAIEKFATHEELARQ